MRNRRTIITILLVLIIVLAGFLREYIFANTNWIYLTLTNGRMNAARPEFHPLLEWSPEQIIRLKWILTGIFSLLFLGLTYLIIQIIFKNRMYNRITLFSYISLLIGALLLHLISKSIGKTNELYGIVRTIMGIVQSFMPLMILYILFRFLPQQKRNK